jgi:tyrosyl-tRNA synthetase
MGFIDELKWRGMLHDSTPGVEELMSQGPQKAYIGFDPTAASLGLGNYVQIMLLTFLQRHGHTPIVLMGGATGRIGDPSGKDKERELKSFDELDNNISTQTKQFKKLLNFESGENKAILVNNYDFYKNMNVLDFLRNVGKNSTINYMLSKESVKRRLDAGISYTEFSYQLLQGYDFYCLYQQHGCKIQMGGSDQWGNIIAGTDYIGKNITDGKAYAITTPLLTKSDGKKFGKTEEGNIWLDEKLTSVYKFYQFWLNIDDADLKKLFRYFSLKSKEEIESLESQHEADPRELKKILSEELTIRIHGATAFENVKSVSEVLFNKNCSNEYIQGLSRDVFEQISEEIPSISISHLLLQEELNLINFLSEHTNIVESKSEARRAIQANAISINKLKFNNMDQLVDKALFVESTYALIENGKKNKFLIKII